MNGGLFQLLKAQGQEFFSQLAGALMSDPRFVKAMEQAWKGKAALESAASRARAIPTRTEFQRALKRIEELEARLTRLEAAPKRRHAAPRRKKSAERK